MNENLAHMQYLPGDPRLVDQLVYELKSKGIFDQFRKECIADVDTRPAYQNLRQRVETSVATFLSRQVWKPDLNKNQLREKLRKHLLDGNYLEQGVERIVDQVVNPKVASVFIPQVEDVVYNYLGIPRKKKVETDTSYKTENDLLPTDLEAVSPGSVKSNDDKSEPMDTSESQDGTKMEIADEKPKLEVKEDSVTFVEVIDKDKTEGDSKMSIGSEFICQDSNISIDKSNIPLPEEIKLENIPEPENSPPKINSKDIDLEKIDLPKEPNPSTDIPLPDEMPKIETETYYSKETTILSTVISTDIPLPDEMPQIEKSDYFKPTNLNSEDDDSSSDSSLRRNMSPLTPIRNFNNENSCDAQQAFENESDSKNNDIKEPSSFRFTIESKSSDNSCDAKPEKKEEKALSYQFDNQLNINTHNTPVYEDSSNSNNLQIDYESDANSKVTTATEIKAPEPDQNSVDSKKEKKSDDKKNNSHKSPHRSRDSHKHSSSKDKRSDLKQSSKESSRHDKKPPSSTKDEKSKSNKDKDKHPDKSDRKDSRESSKHRSSSSHKSSSHKESSSHRDSSSKHKSSSSRHSSSSKHDDKKSSSSTHRDKDKERSSTEKSKNKDKSRDSKSSSHRTEKEKDRKSNSSSSRSKHDDKENKEKKEKKDTDDHYSLSGRGNYTRRSTDRDSNDGSSSSKGSHNPSIAKTSDSKRDTKTTSKSGHTSSTDSTSPRDHEVVPGSNTEDKTASQTKPIRVETHLKHQILSPPRLPFVPDVTLKKPKFAANFEEAKRMMKMRKFLEDEQKRMNQEAALLLEFQANVRPSISQVYSSIPGPELEFACGSNSAKLVQTQSVILDSENTTLNVEVNFESVDENSTKTKEQEEKLEETKDSIAEKLTAMDLEQNDTDNSQANIDQSLETTETVNIESKDTILATLTNDDKNKCDVTLTESYLEQKQVVVIKSRPSDIQHSDQEKNTEYFEVTIITEEWSDSQGASDEENIEYDGEKPFLYFAEHEKFNAEIERDTFTKFYKAFQQKTESNKVYLINCDTYEENLIKEVSQSFGQFEVINYHKNGHLIFPKKGTNIVKNVNISDEVTLPTKSKSFDSPRKHDSQTNYVSPIFSPVKSECSFELSSDYDAKLEEMVNKTSREEIMEIILGGAVEESPSEMPTIDYCMESSIETENNLKRKMNEAESVENNNGNVLTANKIRKLSESDQITSTTGESEETQNNRVITKSKYLGKARRVGLARPRKTLLPNSPSSDKSVENYDISASGVRVTPNGRMKATRNKVQRYDTSELYKPKLHYLSRRNNIT